MGAPPSTWEGRLHQHHYTKHLFLVVASFPLVPTLSSLSPLWRGILKIARMPCILTEHH